ncbi:MAG: cytochrome b/b6 domain-containing protein [Granulosicoccus sp.]
MSNTGYSKVQIVLHWAITLLVIQQVVLHEGIVEFSEALRTGGTTTAVQLLMTRMHVLLGLLVFILAITRVWARIKYKAPPPAENEKPVLIMLSRLTHLALYVVVLLMPISGSLAWFGELEIAAKGHGIAKFVLVAFVLLHVVGALYHHFVLKDNIMKRMLRAE